MPVNRHRKLRYPGSQTQALSQELPLASVPESCWAVLSRGSEVNSGFCPIRTEAPLVPHARDWPQQQQLTLALPSPNSWWSSLLGPIRACPSLAQTQNSLATAPRVERKPSHPPA